MCFADYRNHHQPVHVKITLRDGTLHVALDLEGEGKFKACLSTAEADERLRSLPPKVYIGVTASTGVHADSHVLYSLGLRDLSTPQVEPELPHEPHASHEVHAVDGHTEAVVPVGSGGEADAPSAGGKGAMAPPKAQPKAQHPTVPVPKPQRSTIPTPGVGAAAGAGAGLSGLAERLSALEQEAVRERQAALKRHEEVMGYLRSMRVAGGGGGLGGGDVEPAALGGLASDIAEMKAALERLAGEGNDSLAQMRSAIEQQLTALGQGLSKADEGQGAPAGSEGFKAAHTTISSIQTLIQESVDKLHQLNEHHQVRAGAGAPRRAPVRRAAAARA